MKLLTDDTFRLAAELLDGLGVEWAAVGGKVANRYRPTDRLTTDYDFLVKSLDGIEEKLEKLGFEVVRHGNRDAEVHLVRAHRGGVRFSTSPIGSRK